MAITTTLDILSRKYRETSLELEVASTKALEVQRVAASATKGLSTNFFKKVVFNNYLEGLRTRVFLLSLQLVVESIQTRGNIQEIPEILEQTATRLQELVAFSIFPKSDGSYRFDRNLLEQVESFIEQHPLPYLAFLQIGIEATRLPDLRTALALQEAGQRYIESLQFLEQALAQARAPIPS